MIYEQFVSEIMQLHALKGKSFLLMHFNLDDGKCASTVGEAHTQLYIHQTIDLRKISS